MRSWGKQAFLNPVHSNDDGWFKFSIRRRTDTRRSRNAIEFLYDVVFTVADCSNKANLEFDLHRCDVIFEDHPPIEVRRRAAEFKEAIKARRAKVDMLAKAVLEFRDKLNEAYDELEAELDDRLDSLGR